MQRMRTLHALRAAAMSFQHAGAQQYMMQPHFVHSESNVISEMADSPYEPYLAELEHTSIYNQQQPWRALERPRSQHNWQRNYGAVQNHLQGATLESMYSLYDAPHPMYGPLLPNTTKRQLLSFMTPQCYAPINDVAVENAQLQQPYSMVACQSPDREVVTKPVKVAERKRRSDILCGCC